MITRNKTGDQNTHIQNLIGLWSTGHDAGSDSNYVEYAFNTGGTGREYISFKDEDRKTNKEINVFHWRISDGLLQIVYDTNPSTPVSIDLRIIGNTCMFCHPEMESDAMLLFREGNLS